MDLQKQWQINQQIYMYAKGHHGFKMREQIDGLIDTITQKSMDTHTHTHKNVAMSSIHEEK